MVSACESRGLKVGLFSSAFVRLSVGGRSERKGVWCQDCMYQESTSTELGNKGVGQVHCELKIHGLDFYG
jgi:hypothetical protein